MIQKAMKFVSIEKVSISGKNEQSCVKYTCKLAFNVVFPIENKSF